MEETMQSTPKLLISFVVDNSASVDTAHLQDVVQAFEGFAAQAAENKDLEWELITFGDFTPTVIKAFDAEASVAIAQKGFPLLARATAFAVDRVQARAAALNEAGCPTHRPWVFLLSDGFTADNMAEIAARLDSMERGGQVMYLPFKLRRKLYTERLQALDRNKHMIEIKEGGLQGFFDFLWRMIEQRATLASDVGIKFAKSDFEGWAEL